MEPLQPSSAPYSPPTTPTPMIPTPAAAGIGAGKIIAGLAVLALVAIGAYYVGRNGSDEMAVSPSPSVSVSSTPVACTADAKICPDGSSVGRTGPACEFAPCPTPTSAVPADWKTYTNAQYGFEFRYPTDWVITQSEGSGYSQTFAIPKSAVNTDMPVGARVFVYSPTAFTGIYKKEDVMKSAPCGAISGKTAYCFVATVSSYGDDGDVSVSIRYAMIGNDYLILSAESAGIADQILSTFKFTK